MVVVSRAVRPPTSARDRVSSAAVVVTTVGAVLLLVVGVVEGFGLTVLSATVGARLPVRIADALPERYVDPAYLSPTWQPPVWRELSGDWLWVDVDRGTAALAAAADWVVWPVLGVALLVLAPVLRGLVAGRLLARGYAARVGGVAGLVLLGWTAAYGLPALATGRVIAAGALGIQPGWLSPAFRPQWWPLGVVALLVLLALALHQGARAASDAEGLV